MFQISPLAVVEAQQVLFNLCSHFHNTEANGQPTQTAIFNETLSKTAGVLLQIAPLIESQLAAVLALILFPQRDVPEGFVLINSVYMVWYPGVKLKPVRCRRCEPIQEQQ